MNRVELSPMLRKEVERVAAVELKRIAVRGFSECGFEPVDDAKRYVVLTPVRRLFFEFLADGV